MKNSGKIIAIILIAVLFTASICLASGGTEYADTLYELGLFKGTELGYELESPLTREQAVTTLVRLLGEEENLSAYAYDEVFADVASERWSFPYVMYCYENKITKGTGEDSFSPERTIPAEEYIALVMRLLGYTEVNPENALKESITANLINSQVAREYAENEVFTRGDMVYVMYRSLMTKNADGELLADVLAQKGAISKADAEGFDIYKSSENIDDLIDRLLG